MKTLGPKYFPLILIFVFFSQYCKSNTITLNELGDGKMEILEEAKVFYSSSKISDPSQLSFDNFQPITNYSSGTTKKSDNIIQTWLMFDFHNNTNTEIESFLFPYYFGNITSFTQEGNNWNKSINGVYVNKKERAHPYPSTFPITTSANSSSKILIRINSNISAKRFKTYLLSKYNILADPDIDLRIPENYALVNVFFFGIILFVIIFSIIQYFQVREVSYLYYSAYLTTLFLYFLRKFELWHPNISIFFSHFIEWSYHFENPISLLIYATYLLFVFHFLDLNDLNPRHNKIVYGTVIFFLVYIVIDKIFYSIGGYNFSDRAFLIFRIIFLPASLIYGGYLIFRKRNTLTKYIIFGSLLLVIGAIISLIFSRFLRPEEFNTVWDYPLFYTMLGTVGEIILFSAGLGYKNRLEIENKNKAILKAMRSQMNPHFIFNGLNSVKLLIYEKDDKGAIKYLTRFSKLFRKVLNNSDKDLVNLEEELEMCKVFLQIESLRFKDKFEFDLQIDEDINLRMVDIPPMTIQPHIENAIWHGLLPKEKDCKLDIIIKKNKDNVTCIIDDNGIGRAASQSFKAESAEKKESFGIKLSQERLKINNIKLNIIDKTGEHQQALGTRVEIIIPQ